MTNIVFLPFSAFSVNIDGKIASSNANFGYIPYGQSIMGKIHFDADDKFACQEFKDDILDRKSEVSPFFLAVRGGCSFVQKVRNMENIGVAVGIVIDDHSEQIEQVLMSDDGTGGGIRIPSMLIGNADGQKLLKWFETATDEDKEQLVVMAEFQMAFEDQNPKHVDYDLWLTSSSDRALDFIEDFAKMDKSLGDSATFTPHYVFWECPNCDERYISNDCYGGGRYCAVEPSNMNMKGREIVLEDLRQKCLWNNLAAQNTTDLWWDYIARVHSTCYSVVNEDCSKRAHVKLGLDYKDTETCVKNSFTGSDWAAESTYNVIIDEEIKYWKDYGTNIYPSIVINKKTYRGQIEPLAVYNAICAGFKDPPQQCMKTLKREPKSNAALALQSEIDQHTVTIIDIVLLVLGLILLNVIVVYCCRRRARRDMQSEMKMQIESAVSQYYALSNKDPSGLNAI